MGYLFLLASITCSTLIVSIFKLLERARTDLLQVITFNYFVCAIVGISLSPGFVSRLATNGEAVSLLAVFQGSLFICIFFVMGRVTQALGVGYVAILTKMSVVMPVLFSFVYFDERVDGWKVIGIISALMAIVLINMGKDKPSKSAQTLAKSKPFSLISIFAILAFVGSGVIDSIFKYFDELYAAQMQDKSDFVIMVFGTAGLWGAVACIVGFLQRKLRFEWKNVWGGILLGVPNYFSIYFIVYSLSYFEGSLFFPINNIGVVLLASLVGYLAFRERFNGLNRLGILMALSAILLIMMSNLYA